MIRRIALIASIVWLAAFQIRYTLETIEARATFLFIPFALKPCFNIIEQSWTTNDGLHRGDELLAVNGLPFTGASVYRGELRRVRRYLDAANCLPPEELIAVYSNWPFQITTRSESAVVQTFDVNFANCTCGSLTQTEVLWYCIVPPAFCVPLGLLVAVARPHSRLAWAFLTLAVSLSQTTIVPEFSESWSQTADPLEWQDWYRIPSLVYQSFFTAAWPG